METQTYGISLTFADQSFKTGPNRERLFFRSGPRSRPCLIPNAEPERRIFQKLAWQLRIILSGLIVLLSVVAPDLIARRPASFVGVIAAYMAVSLLAGRHLMASELASLARFEQRMAVTAFYADSARMLQRDLICVQRIACNEVRRRTGMTDSHYIIPFQSLMRQLGFDDERRNRT